MQLGFSQFDIDRATERHDTGGDHCDHGRHPLACEQCDDEERERAEEDRHDQFVQEWAADNDVYEWGGAA